MLTLAARPGHFCFCCFSTVYLVPQIMNKDFPQVLYPVFRLQQSTQRNILGTKWWKKKINELDYWRVNREHVEQMEKLKETKKRNRQRDAQIRKVMGLKEYFLNPKKRQVYVEALTKSVPAALAPATATPTLK